MAIRVKCSTCRGAFRAPDHAAGKKTKCPKCGQPIAIQAAIAPPGDQPPLAPPTPGILDHAAGGAKWIAGAAVGTGDAIASGWAWLRTPKKTVADDQQWPVLPVEIKLPPEPEAEQVKEEKPKEPTLSEAAVGAAVVGAVLFTPLSILLPVAGAGWLASKLLRGHTAPPPPPKPRNEIAQTGGGLAVIGLFTLCLPAAVSGVLGAGAVACAIAGFAWAARHQWRGIAESIVALVLGLAVAVPAMQQYGPPLVKTLSPKKAAATPNLQPPALQPVRSDALVNDARTITPPENAVAAPLPPAQFEPKYIELESPDDADQNLSSSLPKPAAPAYTPPPPVRLAPRTIEAGSSDPPSSSAAGGYSGGPVHVKGHMRNGKWVDGYDRSRPHKH